MNGDITCIHGGFVQRYHDGIISSVTAEYDSRICTVEFCDGRIYKVPTVVDVYTSQYGVTVAPEENLMYLADGFVFLVCYEITTGRIVWKRRGANFLTAIVRKPYLIVPKKFTGILKLDMYTGEMIAQYKARWLEHAYILSRDLLLINWIRDDNWLFDMQELQLLRRFPYSRFNPNGCRSVFVDKAYLEGTKLLIDGRERPEAENSVEAPLLSFRQRVIDEDLGEILAAMAARA